MASVNVSALNPLPVVGVMSGTAIALAPGAIPVGNPANITSPATVPAASVGVPIVSSGSTMTQATLAQSIIAAGPQGGYADLLKPTTFIINGGPNNLAAELGLTGASAGGTVNLASPTSGTPTSVSTGAKVTPAKSGKPGNSRSANAAPTGQGGKRARVLELAQAELRKGVKETSKDNSPDIKRYRTATAGAPGPGPWCAYFVSYIMKQAGMPIGAGGTGLGAVKAVRAWGQKKGKLKSAKSTPQPGDMILLRGNGHMGIVTKVANGKIHTIEGNSSNRVKANSYAKGASTIVGYVSPE